MSCTCNWPWGFGTATGTPTFETPRIVPLAKKKEVGKLTDKLMYNNVMYMYDIVSF